MHLIDRDDSILAFNERVLSLARREDLPLLERLRFLCITSSNLDEFFEVRGAPYLIEAESDTQYATFASITKRAHALVAEQYRIYHDLLGPALKQQGIRILNHKDRTRAQKYWVKAFFNREVRPLLVPVALDPAHPFPQVANKSLNFIVQLGGKDAFGRRNEIAIVKVPRALPRMIRLPDEVCPKGSNMFVALSSVIRAHLEELFQGRSVIHFSQFRVTRHSDLALDEEDVKNLRAALRQGLEHRQYGQAVRLEVSHDCADVLTQFLMQQFALSDAALYRVHGPVNLVRTSQIIDLMSAPDLLFTPHTPAWPKSLTLGVSMFDQMKRQDHLIHQPYQSFDAVLVLLREAVQDSAVMAIKLTIYRTASNSELMGLLREAVRRGKEVTAVVELKARFDEEANINWAEMLESIGAQVVYGVVGLKTHAKMLLITRREGDSLVRYGHLSTGNYNAKTAALYTDFSYLTAQPELVADMDHVFMHLASQVRLPKLHQLWVAPFDLHQSLIRKVAALCELAASGVSCTIVLKMNALTDEPLINALLKAGRSGVKIELIVRGACMLPAQRAGFSDNIQVRSIIGRFLEHSRVFYFRAGDSTDVYLSSADWMSRNMMRRIEIAWPIKDEALKQRIIDECLVASLKDTADAWLMNADGHYVPVSQLQGGELQDASEESNKNILCKPLSAQQALMALHC